MWNEGQVEARAHLFEDIVQNYTVCIFFSHKIYTFCHIILQISNFQ